MLLLAGMSLRATVTHTFCSAINASTCCWVIINPCNDALLRIEMAAWFPIGLSAKQCINSSFAKTISMPARYKVLQSSLNTSRPGPYALVKENPLVKYPTEDAPSTPLLYPYRIPLEDTPQRHATSVLTSD